MYAIRFEYTFERKNMRKKILIILIVGMLVISMIPGIVGKKEAEECNFVLRKYTENRKVVTIAGFPTLI